jgi:hypothetical protein
MDLLGIIFDMVKDRILEKSRPDTDMDQKKSGWNDAWIAGRYILSNF